MSPRGAPLVDSGPASVARRTSLPIGRRLVKAFFGPYMRLYHGLEIEGAEHVPPHGPAIVVVNHASLLDVPALMVLDPFPNTATIVKASLFKVPLISWFLRQWGAIPVERQGRDSTGVRNMLAVLRAGGIMAVAAEGRRTRSGRLEPINPVLARIAAGADVPILPIGIRGSFKALPPGALLPRPRKIVVRVGPAFRLERGTHAGEAAERIRREIAALLPPDMQPVERSGKSS
jgi:1-acyl-sn-glycerol-3-phosphate acyltransferase